MSFLPEALVQVVRAMVADEDLAIWFESLADAPPVARAEEFRSMARRMQAAQSDAELTHAISLLAAPGAYEGVLAAFHEVRETL